LRSQEQIINQQDFIVSTSLLL